MNLKVVVSLNKQNSCICLIIYTLLHLASSAADIVISLKLIHYGLPTGNSEKIQS